MTRGILVSAALLLALTTPAWASDDKIDVCMNCHNPEGYELGEYSADEIATKIKAFMAGDAKHMPKISNLSDDDIAAIAKALADGVS